MIARGKLVLGMVLCLASAHLWAQVTVPDEYGKTIAHHSDIGTLTDDFAGDRIDLNSGRLEISQTDVDLPGNNALPVRVGRHFEAGDRHAVGIFGDWSLDIPSIHGTFFGPSSYHGWASEAGPRCSSYSAPPIISYMGGWWFPDEYWHGTFFYLPGSGDQELLQNVHGTHVPTDGHGYPVSTKAGSVARCVLTDSASAQASQDEGFEMVTPDGLVYTLNHMVERAQSTLRRDTPVGNPGLAPDYFIPRKDFFLYPTRVADRFGNYVEYIWSTSEPSQLLRVQASDGRRIDLTYMTDGSNRVASVTDGTRTWRYTYADFSASDPADTVTQPDGGVWSFRLNSLHDMVSGAQSAFCDSLNGETQRTGYDDGASQVPTSGSITGPSGATVTFSVARIMLGRSHLVYNCYSDSGDDPTQAHPKDPYLFMTAAVVGKTLTGPGLPATGMHWRYAYGPTNNCWDGTYSQGIACTTNSPVTRSVIVADPDGSQTRYTFGNRANVDEGLLYRTERGWNGSSALSTTEITYADANAAPYGPFDGWSPRGNGDYAITSRVRPQRRVVTTQQGRSFAWEVASDCAGLPYCFDAYARPTRVIRSSTP